MLLLRGLRAWREFLEARKAKRRRDVVGTHLRGLVKDIVPDFSPPTSEDDDDDEEEESVTSDGEEARVRDGNERWEDLISLMTV